MDANLIILKENLNIIKKSQDAIVTTWLNSIDVDNVLSSQNIDKELFKNEYAYKILYYFIEVIEGTKSLNQCPVMLHLLDFFNSKNISTSELYIICINFRESMVKNFFQKGLMNEILYDAISFIFDANFNGVLKIYSETIYNAHQETKEFQELVDNSLNEIYIFDKDNLFFTYVNRGAILNTGYSLYEFKQMKPHQIKPDFTLEQFKELIIPLVNHEVEQLAFETIHQRKDKSTYNTDIRLQLMNFDGKEKFVAIINDVSKRVKAVKEKEHFHYMATHDHLTKIYNRQKFDLLFRYEIKRSLRYNHPLSLIIFDIDDFKDVNDMHGHDVGDNVLISISETVNTLLRESDTFARWGGEEFAILLPEANLDLAMLKAEDLRKIIESTQIDKIENITCSFGVSVLSEAENPEQLFKKADSALYLAKNSGKNIVKSYS